MVKTNGDFILRSLICRTVITPEEAARNLIKSLVFFLLILPISTVLG